MANGLLVLAVGLPAMAAVPSAAVSGGDHDALDSVTLNDVDAAGAEIAYAGPARRFETSVFDTAAYTVAAGEPDLNACAVPGPALVHAGRTAWTRFDPAVAGRIDVVAEAPGHDVVLMVRTGLDKPWRTSTLADLQGPTACADQTSGPGAETVSGFPVAGDRVYHVQVGSRCSGGADTCSDPAVPGGPTRVVVTFTPFDADGDGVPDTLDACPGQGLPGAVTANGCPDTDRDGIPDADDDCPTVVGVPQPSPFNGCLAGPIPPNVRRGPFVQIVSLDRQSLSTDRPQVRLRLNWPKGATRVRISNRDGDVRKRKLRKRLDWRLDPSGDTVVRGVRVRFLGPRLKDIVEDTIILDPEEPEVRDVLFLPTVEGWIVGFDAEDPGTVKDPGAGVTDVALLDDQGQLIDEQEVCEVDDPADPEDDPEPCEAEAAGRFVSVLQEPDTLRVTDAAGNQVLVDLAARVIDCPYADEVPVPKKDRTSMRYECFRVRERCGKVRDEYRWDVTSVRCDRDTGRVKRRRS